MTPKDLLEEFDKEFTKFQGEFPVMVLKNGNYQEVLLTDDAKRVKHYLIHSQIQLLQHLIEKAEGEMKKIEPELEPSDIHESGKLVGKIEATQKHIDTLKKLKSEYEGLLD